MSSDTWSNIQALKNKQSSLRERLARRKKERQEVVAELTAGPVSTAGTSSSGSPAASLVPASRPASAASTEGKISTSTALGISTVAKTAATQLSTSAALSPKPPNAADSEQLPPEVVEEIEKRLLVLLDDINLTMPVESSYLFSSVTQQLERDIPSSVVEDLLEKFAAQTWISIRSADGTSTGRFIVESVAHSQLSAVTNELQGLKEEVEHRKRKFESSLDDSPPAKQSKKVDSDLGGDAVESLLSMESAKQRETKKMNEEILNLLSKPTAKEQSLIEKFKSQGGAQVKEFCPNGTKEECMKVNGNLHPCEKLHFRKIIHKHTDESLGDCSFLNTCFHMDTCKYVHYEIDYPERRPGKPEASLLRRSNKEGSTVLFPPQWVQCDMRLFDMSVLGKFSVIMADPPWDIHMELPYGTMSDDEMRKLQVPILQDHGFIFLWVTGRAMELGRECLRLWGYERVDEIIWVKTNQLQRIIRTGRTGHWLNHGKEHCLVGLKGNPTKINRGLDCDVIVAEVRATSHKPDEIYGIIERLAPGTRKIELFGRPHNVQPNWVTLGNQLDGVKLIDPDVVKAFKRRYPDGNCMKPPAS